MLTAIIMASGFSSRMKDKNKLLLLLDNKTIIEHVIINVSKHDFDKIILVTNNDDILSIGEIYNLTTIKNNYAEFGQSESLKLGVLNSNVLSHYMFFVGDQPFLTTEYIEEIIYCHKKNTEKIIIPVLNNKRKTPTIFPNSLRNELLSISGDIGGRFVIKNNEDLVHCLDFYTQKPFYDIDTLSDYHQALSSKN